MRTLLLPLFVICLSLPLVGQTLTEELFTLSDVALLAKAGGKTDHQAVPAKTPILGSTPYGWKPLSIKARLSDSKTYYQSHSTMAYPHTYAVGCNIMERGYGRGTTKDFGGTSSSRNSTGAVLGPHSFLLVIKGKPGTKGKVVVSWHAKADPVAKASGYVDINNDSTIEYTGIANTAERKEFPVTLGTTPLQIKIQTDTSLTGTGNYGDFVDLFIDCFVNFIEDQTTSCKVTNYGTGCGPKLAGGSLVVADKHVITLLTSGGFPNGYALSFVGTQQLNIPIGGSCTLLANAVVINVLKTDANGDALESWKVPVTALLHSYHQVLPVGIKGNDLVLKATNGVKVECKR